MHISFASILTVAALVGAASASSDKGHQSHGEKHHHGSKPHHSAPKGKAFDHILQIWFENQVSATYTYYDVAWNFIDSN